MPSKHRTRTSFRPGYDPRRHIFTHEECVRGGRIRWARFMVELRSSMNLPIPPSVVATAKYNPETPW